jgi:hypothetical protein
MTDNSIKTCKECIHFYVTYEANFPYGCKRMGFKSLRYPFYVVQEATGEPCQLRRAKGSNGPEGVRIAP